MKKHVVILFLSLASQTHGAFEPSARGARALALGGAHIALSSDPWAGFSNPGCLPGIADRLVSFTYTPEAFGLSELSSTALSYVEPTGIGTLSLMAERFGFELYREVVLGAAYGTRVTEDVCLGVGVKYYALGIAGYGNDGSFGLDVGARITLSEAVDLGLAALNLNAPTIGREKERLPQLVSAGLAFRPLPDATLLLDIVKDIRYEAGLQLGVEVTVAESVDLRGGVANQPSTFHAGIGLHALFFDLDYAFRLHNDLGPSHTMGLTLTLGDL